MNTAATTSATTSTDEAFLIARIQDGDQRSCELLVRQFGPRMLTVAKRFFRNEHDANDAVQDAFVSAFSSLDRFAGKSALGTWLHRIVVNACLMKLRRHRNEESIEALLPTFDETGHHVHRPQQWADAAHLTAERAELAEYVRACIDRLPEPYRAVLLLRDIEELDTAETARLLDCTPNNVKVRLHRARQALRQLIEPTILAVSQ